ncbi:hypothetical protein M1D49_00325 [Bacillus sp. PK3-056]|uniref:hypothetical protein n=1 Tax=Niallia circulans TaxID=1397 RepID=UPI0013DE2222|nr:hypothetical protein [Niallia circulans]
MANKLFFRKYVEAREHIEALLRSKEYYGENDSLEKKQLIICSKRNFRLYKE